ncbi:glycoside hydrolase family 44 protein [Archangium primigenium]|uniref:glycoside hydrolase family 44 protein n=1 Tax=[Archangium] primigenium TaxID=2792470 RepID=UPI001EF84227|nr:glycoside hydrolase family 44 protein [Archangium primigenium]
MKWQRRLHGNGSVYTQIKQLQQESMPWLLGLGLCLSSPVWAQNAAATVDINVAAGRHAINPFIYGVAYGTQEQLADLNAPLNRRGGNATSRYNWKLNAANRANDYYFESLPYSSPEPGGEADAFIQSTRAAGAEPLITIPLVGWVANLGPGRAKMCSYSVAKYGAQQDSDRAYYPDAGNGVLASGQNIVNDPADANVASTPEFQKGWVEHLLARWGGAANGGQRFYIMDNEPSLWHQTHRDAQPVGLTMKELRDKHLAHAAMVKSVDPAALIMGPEEWGWSGFLYSGYDHQEGPKSGYTRYPDREANGDWDYLPWLLDQFHKHEQSTGQRLLDVFTVHYYPQGGEFSTDTSSAMQLRRNRSTRSLWDANYVDETWINDKVRLVPRLKEWVATYYPDTAVGITEYNWGAEGHINGATTQAEILGIFGREGLDYAARWETPAATTPTYKAMKLYRNYDGLKSTFGDTSVACAVANPDNLSAFAAERGSDGALTVMVISKVLSGDTAVTLNVSGFSSGQKAQVWQLTSANAITPLADLAVEAGVVKTSVPSQSVTLIVLPSGSATGNQPPVAKLTATPTSGPAPLVTAFDAAGSADPDGTLESHAWNFGDGTQATGATASHTYTRGGTFTVTLTVKDNRGATASATTTVQVTATTLETPTSFYAQRSGQDITLRWTDTSQSEEGFLVERGVTSWPIDFQEVGRVGANVRAFVDKQVPSGNYFYRVRAFKGALLSEPSNMDGTQVP